MDSDWLSVTELTILGDFSKALISVTAFTEIRFFLRFGVGVRVFAADERTVGPLDTIYKPHSFVNSSIYNEHNKCRCDKCYQRLEGEGELVSV